MKVIRFCLLLLAVIAAALATNCNPNHMDSSRGSPPAVNAMRATSKPTVVPGAEGYNDNPQKYGPSWQSQYARIQAGQVGPNANLADGDEQLRFDTTAGRNQSSKARIEREDATRHPPKEKRAQSGV